MTSGVWDGVPLGPPDAILGLNEAYNKDPADLKVNVGVGAYRGEDGKPVILESVKEAERRIWANDTNHEYAGIAGLPGFIKVATKFAYGEDSPAIAEGRLAAVQSLSGTGALRLMSAFVSKFNGAGTKLYVPTPTWGNHLPIARMEGLEPVQYRYVNDARTQLDFEGMTAQLRDIPDGSFVLMHACAHNPTGVDPTHEQWDALAELFKEKGHYAVFDSAYQGFATGDADKDAYAIRKFEREGLPMMLCQSFAKNFGLYGERVGTMSVVCKDAEEAERVMSQLKLVIRPMYSNPPIHGAHIVQTVLEDEGLKAQWYGECAGMAERIGRMRVLLRDELAALGSTHDWSHITDQIGMFCYSGIHEEEVAKMTGDYHVYMTKDGRISMAGVTKDNVGHIAKGLHEVTKDR